jgi:hypothetical protein
MKSIIVDILQQNQLKELHEASSKIQGPEHSPSLSRADIYLAAIYGRNFGFCRDSAETDGEFERGSQTVAGRAPPTYLADCTKATFLRRARARYRLKHPGEWDMAMAEKRQPLPVDS